MLKTLVCLLAVTLMAPLAMSDTLIATDVAGLRSGGNADTNYHTVGDQQLCNFPVLIYRFDMTSLIAANGNVADGSAVLQLQAQWAENLSWTWKAIATTTDFDDQTVTWNSYTGGAADMSYWNAMTAEDSGVFPAAGNFVAKGEWTISEAAVQSWIDNGGIATVALTVDQGYANICTWTNTSWNGGAYPRLVVSTVPEPASMSLLALGGLALIRRRR